VDAPGCVVVHCWSSVPWAKLTGSAVAVAGETAIAPTISATR